MLESKQNNIIVTPNDKFAKLNFAFAFFLVFVTPISIPLAVYTCYQGWVSTGVVWLFLLMFALTGLGITVGYHRLLAHQSFLCNIFVKYVLLVMGAMAMQGSPASWASLHIQHHAHSDKAADPHSPHVQGFWYAHCGWFFRHYRPNLRRYGKFLLNDPVVKHVSKYYIWYALLGLIIPGLILGWVGILWGGLLRLCVSSHLTWSVNSICHMWGKRSKHATLDNSRNNPWVALLTFGEGWHHNHHQAMRSPYFGRLWYEVDMGKWLIIALQSLGLAKARSKTKKVTASCDSSRA